MKILLLDDEPILLRGVSNIIEKESGLMATIKCATSVRQALDILTSYSPDVIFTDINMPGMDGFDFIDEACLKVSCRRFIILTCHSEFEYARKAISKHVYEFLVKPIDKAKLLDLLYQIVKEMEEENIQLRIQELNKLRQVLFFNLPLDELFLEPKQVEELFKYDYFTLFVFKNSINKKVEDIKKVFTDYANSQDIILYEYKQVCTILVNTAFLLSEKCKQDLAAELSQLNATDTYYSPTTTNLFELHQNCTSLINLMENSDVTYPYTEAEYVSTVSEIDMLNNQNVFKIRTYINENYSKDITLLDVAENIHLHPNYISSLFKKITGNSFVQYINKIRIEQAKKLMKENPELTQDNISKMVGYENMRNYYKVFKKCCGETPGEYRSKLFPNK